MLWINILPKNYFNAYNLRLHFVITPSYFYFFRNPLSSLHEFLQALTDSVRTEWRPAPSSAQITEAIYAKKLWDEPVCHVIHFLSALKWYQNRPQIWSLIDKLFTSVGLEAIWIQLPTFQHNLTWCMVVLKASEKPLNYPCFDSCFQHNGSFEWWLWTVYQVFDYLQCS